MRHLGDADNVLFLYWMLVTSISRISENSVNCNYDLFAFLYHCYYIPIKVHLIVRREERKN